MLDNVNIEKHIRGSEKCPECCCGGYSRHENCGGRLHERLVDDDIDDGYVHNYKCEKCDWEEFYPGFEDEKIEFI